MNLNPMNIIEKLINEHGSSTILKERLELLKDQISALEKENDTLKSENAILKDKIKHLESKQNIIFEIPFYWIITGEKKDGPFCQRCFDKDNKLIRLQNNVDGSFICNVCHNSYGGRSNNRILDIERNNYDPLHPFNRR
jgi:regulator of replication initiation timing